MQQVPVDCSLALWAVVSVVEILDLPGHCHIAPLGGCSEVDCYLLIHSFVCSNKYYYKTVSTSQILHSMLM